MAATLRAALAAAAASLAAAQAGAGLLILTEPCVNASHPTFLNQSWPIINCNTATPPACMYSSAAYANMCIVGATSEQNLVLGKCDESDPNQFFVFQSGTGAIAQSPLSSGQCFNVYGGFPEPPGTNIQTFPCGSIPPNEVFAILPTTQIYANGSALCVDLSGPPPPAPPPHEWTWLPGQLGGADALPPATMSLDAAKAACAAAAAPPCFGVSWQGPLNPPSPQLFSFKSQTTPSTAPGWQTLLRCGVDAPC